MEFINKELMKDKKGIYVIHNKVNNYVYVGQTRQPFKKRYWHHAWKLKENTHDNIHLQNAYNQYGIDKFEFAVIECVEDNDMLNDIEIKHIKYFRETGGCYNMQDGGQDYFGYERTDEIKRKIGEKNRIHMTGRKASDETKAKMSEAHKGNRYNETNYKINESIAKDIKLKLINGIKPSLIAKELNISYKIVNAILSNDAWYMVEVEGWYEYLKSRKKSKRFTIEQCIELYELYNTGNYTHKQLSEMYDKHPQSIINCINRAKKELSII